VSWFATDVGDHVRARRDLKRGVLDTWSYGGDAGVVRRGRLGIVRKVEHRFWGDRYTVEFDAPLGTMQLAGLTSTDIRSTGGYGDGSWRWERDIRRGVRWGLFLFFTLPVLVELLKYLVFDGGTINGLIAAVPAALLHLAEPLLVPAILVAVLLSMLRSRR
jgi:hypothetical protein